MTRMASESAMMFADDKTSIEDRKLFVHNLGELLSQTREGIISCSLSDDGNTVTVTSRNGATLNVNVHMDSYFAIIKDVVKYVDQW